MRVLVLVTDAFGGHGGIAKFNRDLLSALCETEATSQVNALPRLATEPIGALPPRLNYDLSALGGKMRFAFVALRAASRRPRPALIICGHINLLPIAFAAGFICRAPVALIIHGVEAWQPTASSLSNRFARKVDAFIAVSEFTRKKFLAWAQPSRAKNFVLPNCVDLTQFTPGPKDDDLLDRYGLREKKVLLTVARLSAAERYKGVDEVLEVLPSLLKEVPNLAYLIVGDGTDRVRLEQKAAQLGVREQVKFCGRIAVDQLVSHHRLGDVFVMPGRGEGFGIVYLEAMACGIPVIASRADASGEVVARVGEGTAVDPGNATELRSAILTALQNVRRQPPPGLNEFSREKFVERCHAILHELLPVGATTRAGAALPKTVAF